MTAATQIVPVEAVRVGDVLPSFPGAMPETVTGVDPNVDGRVEIVTDQRTLMRRRGDTLAIQRRAG